jgi:hypothetical protein
MQRLLLALAVLLVAGASACGASEPAPVREPTAAPPSDRPAAAAPHAPSGPGSSDGTTCEEARDANVEEVGIGERGPADLTAADLGKVLNHGAYLHDCGVPTETHVSICVAVKAGAVLGVTVSTSPASEEQERCVAKAVRALSFPSHPKLDVVRTTF